MRPAWGPGPPSGSAGHGHGVGWAELAGLGSGRQVSSLEQEGRGQSTPGRPRQTPPAQSIEETTGCLHLPPGCSEAHGSVRPPHRPPPELPTGLPDLSLPCASVGLLSWPPGVGPAASVLLAGARGGCRCVTPVGTCHMSLCSSPQPWADTRCLDPCARVLEVAAGGGAGPSATSVAEGWEWAVRHPEALAGKSCPWGCPVARPSAPCVLAYFLRSPVFR